MSTEESNSLGSGCAAESYIRPTDVVYPGHPVVLACLIMGRYKSLDEASRVGVASAAAVEDNDIPGAGGNVFQALDLLHAVVRRGMDPVEAFATYSRQWVTSSAGGLPASVAPGQAQADDLRACFLGDLAKFT